MIYVRVAPATDLAGLRSWTERSLVDHRTQEVGDAVFLERGVKYYDRLFDSDRDKIREGRMSITECFESTELCKFRLPHQHVERLPIEFKKLANDNIKNHNWFDCRQDPDHNRRLPQVRRETVLENLSQTLIGFCGLSRVMDMHDRIKTHGWKSMQSPHGTVYFPNDERYQLLLERTPLPTPVRRQQRESRVPKLWMADVF